MLKNKKRKVKRLKGIEPFETAIVPRGANRSRFVVLKEDGSMKLDLNKLSEVHGTIGRIVTVCKAGTPSAETVQSLETDLQLVTDTLAELTGKDANVGTSIETDGVKAHVDEINTIAESLNESTYDLNAQDQIDVLLVKVKELQDKLNATSAEPTESVVDVASDGDTQNGKKPADADEATDTTAAASEDEAEAEEEPAEDKNEDKTEDEPVAEVVTKADLVDLGKSITEGFKEAMGAVVTTLKSAQNASLLPTAGTSDPVAAPRAIDTSAYDDKHWGNSLDLNE